MITVAEAKTILEHNTPPRRVERVRLEHLIENTSPTSSKTRARVLASDVRASVPSPLFTNSAMDGVALRFADYSSRSNFLDSLGLLIVGESEAGKPFAGTIGEGCAARINTGAMLPDGADTVIPVEDVEWKITETGEYACIAAALKPTKGQFVRRVGAEFQAGEVIVAAGKPITPSVIALLVQQGIEEVECFAMPFIAILATGSELQNKPNQTQGFIIDANTPMLHASVRQSGGSVVLKSVVGDSLEETLAALETAEQQAMIILTTGGVSVGWRDFVRPAAAQRGFETLFWRVQQKPGKPMFAARKGDTLLLSLPGNPVSALMCYTHYVHPLVCRLCGLPPEQGTVQGTVRARLSQEIVNLQGRAEFVRVRLSGEKDSAVEGGTLPTAFPLERQESYMLTSMTEADGFIFIENGATLRAGDILDVSLLNA